MTKKWDKPELTVLVRGNAEEAVLSTCKSPTVGGPGGFGVHECRAFAAGCGLACHNPTPAACSAVGAS